MLKLGCQLRMLDVILGISHSIPSRVHYLQSVFPSKVSLNQQYCIQRSLSTVAVPEKSRDREPPKLQNLFQDNWVMAISKPGSLLVHNSKEATKDEKKQKAFLKDLVEAQHNQGVGFHLPMTSRSDGFQVLSYLFSGRSLFTVHRLDRGASGVILFAKCSLAAHPTQLALAHEDTVKEFTPDSFMCDDPVKDDKGIPRSAWTKCDKLLDLPKSRCSLLKVYIKTGRRHQIRKHLNHKAFHVSPPQPFPVIHWLSILLSIYFKLDQRALSFFLFIGSCPGPCICSKSFPFGKSSVKTIPIWIPCVQVIGDGRHGKGQTNQYFREHYQMPLRRCFLHAARLTIPHPSIFSALCIDKEQPAGSLESLHRMKSEISSEHIAEGLSPYITVESGKMLPSNPETSRGLQIDCSRQALTVRASLPSDLRQVLLALPDGLSCEFLDSFDVVI